MDPLRIAVEIVFAIGAILLGVGFNVAPAAWCQRIGAGLMGLSAFFWLILLLVVKGGGAA